MSFSSSHGGEGRGKWRCSLLNSCIQLAQGVASSFSTFLKIPGKFPERGEFFLLSHQLSEHTCLHSRGKGFPAWVWSAGRRKLTLVTFPIAVIACPGKSNLKENGRMYLGSWLEVIVHGGRHITGRLMQLVTLHLKPRSQEAEGDEYLCSSVFSCLVQSGPHGQQLVLTWVFPS